MKISNLTLELKNIYIRQGNAELWNKLEHLLLNYEVQNALILAYELGHEHGYSSGFDEGEKES